MINITSILTHLYNQLSLSNMDANNFKSSAYRDSMSYIDQKMCIDDDSSDHTRSEYDGSEYLEMTRLSQLAPDGTYCDHEERCIKLWNYKNGLYTDLQENNKLGMHYESMDGPPYVSGQNLHFGHLTVMSVKSTKFNYMNMSGFVCPLRLGYDCHGLPTLNKAASENNMTYEQFKTLPIETSNRLCEEMVFRYKSSWKPTIQRIGRLADFNNDYMTRNPDFMESCWWVFKQIYQQGNVYKGEKVMPYSYGNQTPLSNFEASQNFQEKQTKSIFVAFEIVQDTKLKRCDNTYFVAWTTTPWTLPMNLALCINPNGEYLKIRATLKNTTDSRCYIIAKSCLSAVFDKSYQIEKLNEMLGLDLIGTLYKPIYNFTQQIDKRLGIERSYKIVGDTYVDVKGSTGSGIVHLAPAFGDDDYRVCYENGLIDNTTVSAYCPVDEFGKFTKDVPTYVGKLVFDTEDAVRAELKHRKLLLKTHLYTHNYPYCWRTNTPLIYKTNPSYYIRATAYRDRMVELNSTVEWIPKEIGEGRFHHWLKDVKDWSVSRSTSYATPIPIWRTEDDDNEICIGSIQELKELSGIEVQDLHPQYVNHIEIIKDGKVYRRIPDTFDCWFESGCVPFAQYHYPFNPRSKFLESLEYLSDFVCEGLDQTRGWFYTLMVISTAILDKAPFRTVVCTGMVLDSQGRKFSKKLANFTDPLELIDKYGADTIRCYLVGSPVLNAESLKFNEVDIMNLKKRLLPYINGVVFWIEHTLNYMKSSNIQSLNLNKTSNIVSPTKLMDRWILAKVSELATNVKSNMDKHSYARAIDQMLAFIDDITNWYIKFNRDRLKGLKNNIEWLESIYTLYNVFMIYIRLWAPIIPFLSEHLYQHLKHCSSEFKFVKSVLMTSYPNSSDLFPIDRPALQMFADVQRVCEMVRSIRNTTKYHNKMIVPLLECTIYHNDREYLQRLRAHIDIVQSDINCRSVNLKQLDVNVQIVVKPVRNIIGTRFKKNGSKVIDFLSKLPNDTLKELYDTKKSIIFTTETEKIEISNDCYVLSKVPVENSDKTSISSLIDGDLMVSIDHTYNTIIHKMYQLRRLVSTIQNMRKVMSLRPWNHITVILDKKYANDELKNELAEMLMNTNITIDDYELKEDSDYIGMSDDPECLSRCEEFVYEKLPFEAIDCDIIGKVTVCFSKTL